ncbi:stemmadenine O-acetyltransferase-like, partial [Euphorbia lathyris]|uniref:stemmadenine O-acetyltransferase-like n=1 Tax=Euphorbia lathyris TaxID=212925 RepID=UPI0033139A21
LKMKLEIEVLSKEIIKPSSPTPNHLRHYKLSFLDQISPPVYHPFILFYPTDFESKLSNLEKYNLLKQSLSEVLEYYYPLAGRIKDNRFVDCNDEGILYFQAKVSCKLSLVLENPVPTEMKKLLPFELDEAQELPLGVQFNVFECGGICIGLCISHKIADALSCLTFMKNWAKITCGDEDIVRQEFISDTVFPQKDISGYNPANGISKETVATKKFLFSANSVQSLRENYAARTSSDNQKPPSRIEALSVFIWSRFMAAKSEKDLRNPNLCLMLHAVNLRPRMDPPFPENSFGNYSGFAITIPPVDYDEERYGFIRQMRDSIRKIDKEHVKKLQDGNEHLDFIKGKAEMFMKGEMSTLSFTSLCRFPLHEANFGWGKPVWVGAPSLTFNNLVLLVDAAFGDGIEAVIHLKEEDMVRLQEDRELLQYVTCYSLRSKI